MSSRYSGGVVRKNQLVPTTSSASGVWNLGEATQATKADIWPYANIAMPISQSLRFRSSASAYLSRTGSTATNAKLATYSFWFKRGALTTGQWLFTGGTTVSLIGFNGSSDLLSVLGSDSTGEGNITTAVFRDPSAWYHVVIAIDTSQATTADRAKIYVNGVLQTVTVANGGITLNSNWGFNTAGTLNIGRYGPVPGSYTDGEMADVNFIDGQTLTPSSFGQTSAVTGVWEPKQYTGTYGTNGFHLEFKDTTVGQDTSGNNNDWTPNNISTTLGTTYDLMKDVPTQWAPRGTTDVGGVVRGNYATYNPLCVPGPNGTSSWGNQYITSAASGNGSMYTGTMAISTPGKWYWEYTVGNIVSGYPIMTCWPTAYTGDNQGGGYCGTSSAGTRYNGDGSSNVGFLPSFSTGDICMFAYDASNGKTWIGKNGTWHISGDPVTGSNPTTTATAAQQASFFPATSLYNGATCYVNFGQRPFAYTPPSGFKPLCTTNLPTPTIGATVATAANKNFDISLYSGSGATPQTITNSGFQPDLVWTKPRSSVGENALNDSVRGASKLLILDNTAAEGTDAQYLTSFNSNGYSLGTNNWSGTTVVGWQWKAGGAAVTNTTGSISAQVSANPATGFSIATFTGNGTGGATVGHGLGIAPEMIMFKGRNTGTSGLVWHIGYGTNQGQMLIDSTAAVYNPGNGLYFNSTYPSSTVVTLGTSGATNGNGQTYVLYSWAPVAGYSSFGKYTGNGSSDGPFVHTGFRPRWVMVKASDAAGCDWTIYDTARATTNQTQVILRANLSNVEATGGLALDILSNGFKFRESGGLGNDSGVTYIYAAYAEHPFKNALAR
jgi:hypothetical protein